MDACEQASATEAAAPPEEAAAPPEAAAAPAETLSKNARKRLLKLETKESRKAKRAEERKLRKARRAEAGEPEAGEAEELLAAAADSTALDRVFGAEHHAAARRFFAEQLGAPRLVLAPMVNQSELAFRLLARRHGAGLCYTPMLHSKLFAAKASYREDNFDPHASDRPLVAQFCGDDPATILAAAAHVQGRCDAVDLNCGCPQAIARKGHYGAFLLDEPELIERIVRTVACTLRTPIFVKIRILPAGPEGSSEERTLGLARRLQAAGCSLLTVHGRTREQKCRCECDWALLAKVKAALSIPVLANGGVESPEQLEACLAATGCDGAMVSEAALENPSMLGGVPTARLSQCAVAREYVELARAHPPKGVAIVKAHLFKILFMALDAHRELRDRLGSVLDSEEVYAVALEACEREEATARDDAAAGMSERCDRAGARYVTWYRRHRSAPASEVADEMPPPLPEASAEP
jgi:tRNA-dihydrouridine synthase 1